MSVPTSTLAAEVALMGMVLFGALFPEVARTETRTLKLIVDRPPIAADAYGLLEMFCIEQGCDCRRVMLNVHSMRTMKPVAMINYAFDPEDDMRGPFLNDLNAKDPLALALLDLVRAVLENDADYVKRLERHYSIVKAALMDPEHPVHKRLPEKQPVEKEFAEFVGKMGEAAATTGRSDPCPCGAIDGNGRRKEFKNCCYVSLDRVGPPTGSRSHWAN
jgi:hypothetical protein